MNQAAECCAGEPASCEVPRPGRCARCGGELAAWTRAWGGYVYCSWFCWSRCEVLDEQAPADANQRRRIDL